MLSKLIKNSSSNLVVMVVRMFFTFLMAPAIVRALGNYDYGLWEIVFSLVGYMGFLDIGLSPSVVRYVSKYNSLNDRKSLDDLFSTAFVFSSAIGVIGFCILIGWALINPELLAEKGIVTNRYYYFLLIIAVQVLFQFPGQVAECFHAGYQRYHLTNTITVINIIVGNSIILYLLTNGHGLLTLAIGNTIGMVSKYIVYFVLLFFEKFGGYRIKSVNISREMLSTLIQFGSKSIVAGLASTIVGSASTLLIGFFIGPAAIPFYSIPSRLLEQLRGISTTITNVFMPAFSQIHALEQKDVLSNIYLASTKYICSFVFPMTIGMCLLGKPFIARWMGVEYADKGALILYILAGANLIFLMNPLFNQLLTGINQIGFLIKIRMLSALTLVVLGLILIKPMGTVGIASAFLVMCVFVKPIEIRYICKILNIKNIDFINKVYSHLLLPNIIMSAVVWVLIQKIHPASYQQILLIAVVGAITYLPLFVLFTISGEEKAYLIQKVKFY